MARPLCISTLDLGFFQHGGVVTKARAFAQIAAEEGFSPFFLTPSLPLHRTLRRGLSLRFPPPSFQTTFEGYPCHQFGACYPEFESNAHRFAQRPLKSLLSDSATHCFAVSGNNHAARPFWELGLSYRIWPGSTFWEDCRHRVLHAPWSLRKALDLLEKSACEKLERRIFQSARQIAVDTQYTQKQVLQLNPGWSPKMRVIPVPVDCQKYQPLSAPARNHLVFLGRLSDPRKNLNLLLKAFALCAPRIPSLDLTLIGGADSSFQDRIAAHPCSQRIRRFQGISESEKIGHIQNALALVIPSFQEGYGIAGAEALACGVPVISTPCGGSEDYVIDQQTGLLLRGFESSEMADAILHLHQERTFQTRLGRQAREFALQRLSLEAVRPLLRQFIL